VGKDAKVNDPGSILMFRDHLTFLPEAMTPERIKEGLLDVAMQLEKKQREFAAAQGIKLYGELRLGHHGSEAICHSKISRRTRSRARSSSDLIHTRPTPAQSAASHSASVRRRSSTPGSRKTSGCRCPRR